MDLRIDTGVSGPGWVAATVEPDDRSWVRAGGTRSSSRCGNARGWRRTGEDWVCAST